MCVFGVGAGCGAAFALTHLCVPPPPHTHTRVHACVAPLRCRNRPLRRERGEGEGERRTLGRFDMSEGHASSQREGWMVRPSPVIRPHRVEQYKGTDIINVEQPSFSPLFLGAHCRLRFVGPSAVPSQVLTGMCVSCWRCLCRARLIGIGEVVCVFVGGGAAELCCTPPPSPLFSSIVFYGVPPPPPSLTTRIFICSSACTSCHR